MSHPTMLIYTAFDGAESKAIWESKEEYELVRKFLKEKGVSVSGIAAQGVRTDGVFVYVENERQLEELSNYVQSLREARS